MKQSLSNLILFVFLILSCSGESNDDAADTNEPDKITPSNLTLSVEIVGLDSNNPSGDGSGVVRFTASANNAVNFSFRFGTGDSEESSSGSVEYTYTDAGTNTYNVNVLAYSSTNHFVSTSKTIEVYVTPPMDADLVKLLSGGSQKSWKVNAAYDAHFSNGDKQFKYSTWWEASAFSKSSAGFYDDKFIFKSDGTYIHETNGDVFGKANYLNQTFGNTGQLINNSNEIEKYTLSNYQTTFSVSKENYENKLIFQDKGFVGFFVGQHEFTIECYDDNNLFVRTVDDQNRAWYIWLTDQEVSTIASKDLYTNLIWQEEFNYNGKIDSNKWVYEVRDQWYNEELQATTDRLENVIVKDGKLKIIAKRENYNGKSFTSGRIKSNGKFDFTYGRVDIRAKLPGEKGTWPALWLLGSNYDDIDWPQCGEIDIMEHAGNRLNKIQGTVHHPDKHGSGDGGETNEYTNVSTAFNTYSVVWNEKAITFLVNDKPFHIVGNACALPFNWDFFLILNIAMGGTFGGSVPDSFVSDIMEVDYVRVYQ